MTARQSLGDVVRRAAPDVKSIAAYYVHTTIDYRIVWQNRRNLAFHFGYFDETTRNHAQSLENANRRLAELAGIGPGDRVLDAGCGTGGSAFWLAENRGARVLGIAVGEQAIAEARSVARRRGLADQARFQVADYTAMPFADASFDVVWALESLCHAPVKAAFYQEAARVLRPGGRLVLAEYMRRRRGHSPAEETLIARWLEGWAIPDIDTAEEHMAAAEAAGFGEVTLHDFTPLTRRSLRKLWHRAIAARPLNKLLYLTRQRNRVQYLNVTASRLQYEALKRDAWFYGVMTATRR